MEDIGSFDAAEKKVFSDASHLLQTLRENCIAEPKSTGESVKILSTIRDLVYENLNQIQHEYLILLAAKYVVEKKICPEELFWQWNPRQTGGSSEPDLQGMAGGIVAVSAEVTTSRRPIGTIDKRMRTTLAKLESFSGRRFYFVRTREMGARAVTIIKGNGYQVAVVILNQELSGD